MVSKINCGITGHKGVLGSEFIKCVPFKFTKFKGDITNKGLVDKWIKSNKFDLIIHFAAIVPTNKVNNNYKKALEVNFNGTKNLIDSIVKNKINLNWFFFHQLLMFILFQINQLVKKFCQNHLQGMVLLS